MSLTPASGSKIRSLETSFHFLLKIIVVKLAILQPRHDEPS
eukprot:CAMPEP_0201987516 /NCGR_PEP_ID=MMETSP0904-20121228/91842_1 /ASSEMBLY_ACC=CAM_ASM_000553 /TAXON_ID=420261 /ORGANISM="Thalassiosira antarctica, Strain CCMP982" /LENGTH=40 /DNA_ID= /DNA_START= /DNA_END= /DNA_ORIENTATION=